METVNIIHPETNNTATITVKAWFEAGYQKRGWILANPDHDCVFTGGVVEDKIAHDVIQDPAVVIESVIDESLNFDEPTPVVGEIEPTQETPKIVDVPPVVEFKVETATGVPDDRKCPYCGGVARSDESYIKYHGTKCRKYKGE